MSTSVSTGGSPTALRSLPGRYLASLTSNSLTRWTTGFVLAMFLVLLVLPVVAGTSPTAMNVGPALSPPSLEHWFGTDQLGRDVATRVLHGARLSLLVAVAAAVAALTVGAVLGAIAAATSGKVGEIIMRALDVVLAFPGILLAIVLAAAIGPSMTTTIIVLSIVYSPSMARVVRAAVFAEYGEDYVTAARLIGTSRIRLVGYHIGANAALPVLVYTTLIVADGIMAEAALSFLGAGIKPPAPSWGNIIHDGQAMMDAGAWWISLFPGLAIAVTVLSLNRFSEALGYRLRSR